MKWKDMPYQRVGFEQVERDMRAEVRLISPLDPRCIKNIVEKLEKYVK